MYPSTAIINLKKNESTRTKTIGKKKHWARNCEG
jgi:hypothetical protein